MAPFASKEPSLVIKFACPACAMAYNAQDSQVGTAFSCRRCKAALTVPEPQIGIQAIPPTLPIPSRNLATCPDCSAAISRNALQCPKCGCPFDGPPTIEKPQIIEQTAKKWKLLQLVGLLLTVVGGLFFVLTLFLLPPPAELGSGVRPIVIMAAFAFIIFLAGLTIYTIGRTAAWWHHG
jgi:hypothetical protein